jgi:Ca-activated chloride channel homolog
MKYLYEHLDWRELANRLSREQRMDEIFRELLLATNGDIEQALSYLSEISERFRDKIGFDREQFEQHLRQQGLVKESPNGRTLSARGSRALRSSCLDAVFGALKNGAVGEHRHKKSGTRGDLTGEKRPWAPGDDFYDIAFQDSMLNALRSGRQHLESRDVLINERESSTSAATVMLIDVSHSMTLYGEDRITPAKRVALAFAELQQRFFPRDSLHILLFGDDVEEVSVAQLPFISNGPFHTNTCEALRRAAEILSKQKHPNKRVVMITDGKPTALFTAKKRGNGQRELFINSSYGLDPEIVTATLNQGARYPRLHIELSIFMVASDPYLERFVSQLVDVSKGRAFRASLGELGNQVLGQIYGRR